MLINAGANLDSLDLEEEYHSPLCLAIENGEIEIAKLLIDAEANLDSQADHIPLFCAIEYGQTEIVKMLIDAGANVDSLNDPQQDYNLPICMAIGDGKIEIVKLLLDARANLELKDDHGFLPLHFAAIGSDVEILKLLLSYDAGKKILNEQDNGGCTALHLAAVNNRPKNVDILLSQENIDLKLRAGDDNETALDAARRFEVKDIFESILKKEKELASRQNTTWVERSAPKPAGSNIEL
jgi:ankyrin repeat protein